MEAASSSGPTLCKKNQFNILCMQRNQKVKVPADVEIRINALTLAEKSKLPEFVNNTEFNIGRLK